MEGHTWTSAFRILSSVPASLAGFCGRGCGAGERVYMTEKEVCVCVCVCMREKICVCKYVCERVYVEREVMCVRESVFVRERVCVTFTWEPF